MATSKQQYDPIQAPYDHARTSSIALIEHDNVRTTIAPFITNARVLELACGSGFYTYSLLEWGASSVVGVDISPVMMDKARSVGEEIGAWERVSFIQADCTVPKAYEGGPFDLVFGAWLLNYAPDHKGLVAMFRNVAMNLKDGGKFVSITVPPSSNPIDSLNAEASARPEPEGSGLLMYKNIKDVEDGIFFGVHADTPVGKLYFECYHLRKEVYESAAREAGLKGKIEWGVTEVPERFLTENAPGGATLRELETYNSIPAHGVLVITK
jgi:SAM-dependent methyltransferase